MSTRRKDAEDRKMGRGGEESVCVCVRRTEWNRRARKEKIRVKFRHCEMTRVVFIAATPAERERRSRSQRWSSVLLLRSLLRCIDKSVGSAFSASRSFVAPFSDITAPSRVLALGAGRMRVIATKSLRGIEEVPQLGTHKT